MSEISCLSDLVWRNAWDAGVFGGENPQLLCSKCYYFSFKLGGCQANWSLRYDSGNWNKTFHQRGKNMQYQTDFLCIFLHSSIILGSNQRWCWIPVLLPSLVFFFKKKKKKPCKPIFLSSDVRFSAALHSVLGSLLTPLTDQLLAGLTFYDRSDWNACRDAQEGKEISRDKAVKVD